VVIPKSFDLIESSVPRHWRLVPAAAQYTHRRKLNENTVFSREEFAKFASESHTPTKACIEASIAATKAATAVNSQSSSSIRTRQDGRNSLAP